MAENPFFNRVDERNGSVIMDISDTTATANDVLSGKKFYSASGAPSTGTLVPGTITEVQANGTSVAKSGIANIPAASTSGYGVTKLNNTTSSTSTSEAATAAVAKQLNDNLNKSVSQVNASPQSGESLFQLNGLKFYRARSSYGSGWVLELRGTDAEGKDVRIGFDRTSGIYCYYDNTLQWNIKP